MFRFLSILLALALAALVVWLGFRSAVDDGFIVWFGLASAFVVPICFTLFTYALSGTNKPLLERLARVPQINDLMTQADTLDEKVRKLQEQEKALDQLVAYEAQRLVLESRRASLEQDAVSLLRSLDQTEAQLVELKAQVATSAMNDQIQKLRRRLNAIDSGDIIFPLGKSEYVLHKNWFDYFFVGEVLYIALGTFAKWLRSRQSRNLNNP